MSESTAQESPFPTDTSETTAAPAAADEISRDAEAKKKVLAAAKEIPDIFKPEQVEWVFDAYAAILSFIYSLVLKVDYKVIGDELKFEKDEKALMSKPLARILSKYAPSEWAGMSAEIELITMMGIWTATSYKRAASAAQKAAEKKTDEERTRPVQPIRRGEVLQPA